MKLTSESFADMGAIPDRCAFAVPDAKTHSLPGAGCRRARARWR